MKSVNIMNFVRQCEPRSESVDKILFETTKKQLALVNELQVPNTFLLQYDALCDDRFVKLFKEEAGPLTETGLWYEIVEPLTSACGMKYESERGWKWDWHIKPGFSMAYTPDERDRLIDEAMRKFKEIFGEYPGTVGSWLIDARTASRLADRYGVKCLCICRDQTNTDAYSLVGGYFNGAYYPSRNNIFTPAQTADNSLGIPVLRLLGPDPIRNYDGKKFLTEKEAAGSLMCTLEPVWYAGSDFVYESALLEDFFGSETLNFAYAQIGQENSFGDSDIISPLRRQIEAIIQRGDVAFEKMTETAEKFGERFGRATPPSVTAGLKNPGGEDVQSVYYQCKNYVADIFRDGGRVFIRAFYLFDENVPEHYIEDTCDSFYALYENLPVVDTVVWSEGIRENIGLTLDSSGGELLYENLSNTSVKISWKDKSVIFTPEGIETSGISEMTYDPMKTQAEIEAGGQRINYKYKGAGYSLLTNGSVTCENNIITIKGTGIRLTFERK